MKMARRPVISMLFGATRGRRIASAILLSVGTAVGVDGFLIEPYAVTTTHPTTIAAVHGPLTIAHLSDLHTHGFGSRERRVLAILDDARPDLIVLTGDVLDGGSLEPAREFLAKLHAPFGVWVVRGNWEHWKPPPNERETYASLGATLLVNEGRLVRSDIWLAGLDDSMSGHADATAALRDAPPGVIRVALFHSPAYFDDIAPRIDLALAGHTHGGQVRLPGFGPLWLPPGSGRFVEGWYESGSARMYVSRGIGTSILPVRFASAPEVALLRVVPR